MDHAQFNDWFSRRAFIGGSDARIIMGTDEAALVPSLARKTRRSRARGPIR
jgi:predicted phage-related endonuclease